MTRLPSALEVLGGRGKGERLEKRWWIAERRLELASGEVVQVGPVLQEGSYIELVKMQAWLPADPRTLCMQIVLSLVGARTPSADQVRDGERIIPWIFLGTELHWHCIGEQLDEVWPCGLRVRGANMRPALVALTDSPVIVEYRVGVLWTMA